MDLVSGTPYWPLRNGLIASYPPLAESLDCEVLVLGAGVTGAFVAWQLVQAGLHVVVLDRRDVASGSSSISTGLVQYELDTPLRRLARRIGEADAVRAYRRCRDAVVTLEAIDRPLHGAARVRRTGSLQGATRVQDVPGLRAEFELRQRHGLACRWWDRAAVRRATSLPFAAALVTEEAGQVDTYRLTHALLHDIARRGGLIFDRTCATRRTVQRNDALVRTDRGFTVTARHVVIATGYETETALPPGLTRIISTFAAISEPCTAFPGWPGQRVVWETARPYHYLARTDDGRALIGGGDATTRDPRQRERLRPGKARALARRFRRWLPEVGFEPAFDWAGAFAETPDGLPYLGPHPAVPRTYFALGYGGNGIPFSLVASELIRDLICEGISRDADLFGFSRLYRRRS